MLLKKQTVWLLTMLSLVVVLSAYYIFSPEQTNNDLAVTEDQNAENEQFSVDYEVTTTETDNNEMDSSTVASDEWFDALRLNQMEERSKMKEELTNTMAMTDLPASVRSDAHDRIQEMDEMAQKEAVLETLIVAMGYEDALVRADNEKVRITVRSNEPTAQAANDIIQMVKTEIGQMRAVAVEFQPSN